MKKITLFVCFLAGIAPVFSQNSPAKNTRSQQVMSAPTGLTIEYIRDPAQVLIKDFQPEFGWLVPQSAVFQTGYQVIVATSSAKIAANEGDAWDSGRVTSTTSASIPYQGTALQAGKTYYWKVRVWGASGQVSSYSSVQQFRMGKPDNELTTGNYFQVERVKPRLLRKKASNAYFVDFGKDAFANLELNYTPTKPDTLIIHLGEQLENGAINRKPTGTIRYQEVRLGVSPNQRKYTLRIKPDQRNTGPRAVALPDSFPVLMPFRYCEIENATQPLQSNDLTQVVYHSYWEENQSYFNSSDSILNKIWDMCKYSIKATTFAGLYVDGERERIPYEADAYLNQLSHYTTDREYAIARRTIEYFMQHPTWPTEWQLHVAMMFYADYQYTGNTELIEKYYEPLKYKTLMELDREDGLISSQSPKNTPEFMKKLGFTDPKEKLSDITDWPPAQKDTGWKLATAEGERDGFVFRPINTMINSFYYKNMVIMAEFAKILGKTGDELDFQLRAAKVRAAINEKLFDKTKGCYVDGEGTEHSSVHANMTALAFGVTPDTYKKSVAQFIKSRGMACSVYGAQYLMEALYEAGAQDYALELLTDQSDRSWYNMIRIGATITLEAWDMKYKPNSDWNHAWGAVPANIIPRQLWGIQPKTAGGSVVSIKPQLGKLTSTEIKVPFMMGTVAASYKKMSETVKKFTFDIPANMSAEVELKINPEDKMTVNGRQVASVFKALQLGPGKHEIELKAVVH